MTRFGLGVRTSNVTSGQALCEIIAGNIGCRVWPMFLTLATAVTGVFGVGRPAVAGITPTTPVQFLGDGLNAVSTSRVALAWATSPTAPMSFYTRISAPGTVGSFWTIGMAQGIWVPPGQTLTLHNITGGPTLDLTIEISE
jgi:hypothetical protein